MATYQMIQDRVKAEAGFVRKRLGSLKLRLAMDLKPFRRLTGSIR